MFGRLYQLPKDVARERADELLEQFTLATPATGSRRTTPAACVAGSTSRAP